MAIGSKPSLVLAESSPLASSRFSLSSLSSVFQNNPLISYPAAALTNHSSSNLSCQIKKTLSSVDNENWTGAMRSAPLVDDLSLVNHFSREEYSKDEVETTYGLWQDDYPSALTVFDQMMKAAKGKRIAVFLDYDGTLSPIVEDPEKAFMSDAMRSVVKDVAKHFPTAIISGRSRDKVFNFVQLTEVYYAGSHGLDIMAPAKTSSTLRHTRSKDKKDNNAVIFQPASEFLPMMKEVFKLLQDKIKQIQGARVENNKFCVTVHFRCVEEKNWSALADIVRNVTKPFPRLHLNLGKKVLEIRPSIKWHKGDALEYLLEALGLGDKNEVIPLYIGDDRTDEDAFKALNARGQGYSILVSSVPRETNASYSLRNPTEVMSFLHHLVKWKKNFSRSRSMG